jgi:ectonucleotide pyrophosphatase/phosphodiesterase family protein 5
MNYSLKLKQSILAALIIILFAVLSYSQSQPYVILISFDGYRWDYVNRGITPNINSLIDGGVKTSSFEPVFPTKTFPNHISIITGLYSENHGIIFNDFKNPFNGREYKIRDSVEVRDSRWYKGEAFWETARRQGIITASYFWPNSDINLEYSRPDYFHHYEHERQYDVRVNGVLDWLQLPYDQRPHFITMYFDLTDGVGHRYGPNSPEIDIAISSLDSTLGNLLSGLEEIQMRDSVNIILVSDHGMTEVHFEKIINVEEMLEGYRFVSSNSGSVMMISADDSDIEKIYSLLKKNENHYKVYMKNNIPPYYHFSKSPMISEILLVAEMGWAVITNKNLKWMKPENYNGNHGYDNHHLDMHGVFIAAGPQFKNNYKTGTINCLDVYPLLCKIFNIIPNNNIDGNLERIEFILNEDLGK